MISSYWTTQRPINNFNSKTSLEIRLLLIRYHGMDIYIRGVSKSSQTVIVVTPSVKEDEREGQGHISANLLHQSAT
jgi:hypothetical protein